MKKSVPNILLALVALATATAGISARAQETIKLKISHPLPASHYLITHGTKVFTDAVTERTKGKIQFEEYPASQLGKDAFAILKSGLADVTMMITGFNPDKFPLSPVTELPGMYSTACAATSKTWELAKPGGLLDKFEYAQHGIHVFFVSTLVPYSLNTVSKKLEKVEDLSGLKIWANGAAQHKMLTKLGAVPIRMIGSELYDSISRGTIDGVFQGYPSIQQYKLDNFLRHGIAGPQLGSGTWVLGMNDKAWKALPQSQRDILTSAGAEVQKSLCKYLDDAEGIALKEVMAKGLALTTLSPAQAKVWNDKVSGVADEWAAEMDAAGKPGKQLLDAMRRASSTNLQ